MLIIDHISKHYDAIQAVDNFNIQIDNGQVISLIGPNGAGKTTILNIVAGLLKPDSGQVLLNDSITLQRAAKRKIGFFPQMNQGYPKRTIAELIQMEIELKYNNNFQNQAEQLLKDFELSSYKNRQLEDCSTGMKKKFEVIMTLLGEPELILLDEPTNGMDTTGIITLKQYLLSAQSKGSIILLSSHVLDFVSKVATRSLLINHGSLIKCVDQQDELEQEYSNLFIPSTSKD